jgi:hypothetical protein
MKITKHYSLLAAYKIVTEMVMSQVQFLLKLTPTNHITPITTTAQNVLNFIQEMYSIPLLEAVIMKKKKAVSSRHVALKNILIVLKNTTIISIRQQIVTFFAPYLKQIGYHYLADIEVSSH